MTGIRSFARVGQNVVAQSPHLQKCLWTVVAVERFFARVRLGMRLQLIRRLECFVTEVTPKCPHHIFEEALLKRITMYVKK